MNTCLQQYANGALLVGAFFVRLNTGAMNRAPTDEMPKM